MESLKNLLENNKYLEVLHLNYNEISELGGNFILDGLASNKAIKEISLMGNYFSQEFVNKF